MGKYNVGIGLYNNKLSVYTIANSKFFKINNKIDENIDIIENLKSIKKMCKKHYNTEEEIEVVLSIQENLPDEVKYKIKNIVKIAGFVLKDEINEEEAISLAYGIEEEDGFIFIISINKENSTLKVISSEYNFDCILDLDINIKDKKNTDDMKVIKYIQDKIKNILKDMNYDREYKVILLGDILKDNLFNQKISNKISNIYNYREDALAMGCAIKSYDNSYDIKVFKENGPPTGGTIKANRLDINLAQFYYTNKQYNKAKDVLKELLKVNLNNEDEYIKSLIYLLHIYIIEKNIEEALPIYLDIRKIHIKNKELEKLYKQIISKYEPMLIDKYKMRVLRFKYDIMNIIDNGFEFNIDINQKIIDYEVKIKNNSTILNLNKEFIIDELRNEIKTLNENIDIRNINVFLDLRSKIDEIIKYLE